MKAFLKQFESNIDCNRSPPLDKVGMLMRV